MNNVHVRSALRHHRPGAARTTKRKKKRKQNKTKKQNKKPETEATGKTEQTKQTIQAARPRCRHLTTEYLAHLWAGHTPNSFCFAREFMIDKHQASVVALQCKTNLHNAKIVRFTTNCKDHSKQHPSRRSTGRQVSQKQREEPPPPPHGRPLMTH